MQKKRRSKGKMIVIGGLVLLLVCILAACSQSGTLTPNTGDAHVHTPAVIEAIPATCMTAGKTEGRYCSTCDAVLVVPQPVLATGHKSVSAGNGTEPTCATAGQYSDLICEVCHVTLRRGDVRPAIGHTEVPVSEAVAATCTTPGMSTGKKCVTCGEVLEAPAPTSKGEHQPAVRPAIPATCTTGGVSAGQYCRVCHTVLVPSTPLPAAHTPVIDAAVPATCTATGLTAGSHCGVCAVVLTPQTVIPSAHTPAPLQAVPATCTQPGLEAGEACSVCSVVLTSQQTALALTHDYTEIVTAPTCAAPGYTTHTCTRAGCGDTYIDTYVAATGQHTWDKTAVTCTVGRACTVLGCGATEPKAGHDVAGVTATPVAVEGKNCVFVGQQICKTCSQPVLDGVEVTRHTYIATITKNPTCVLNGEKTYVCQVCTATGTVEPIAKDKTVDSYHTWDAPTAVGNATTYTCQNSGCVQTKTVLDLSAGGPVSAEVLKQNDHIALGGGIIMNLDPTLQNALGTEDITLAASTVPDKSTLGLSSGQLAQIGDNPVYDFTMETAAGAVAFGGGSVTVTLPYTLSTEEDADAIRIWYVGENGVVESIPATYSQGRVTFTVTHFSYYTVTRLTPEESCALYGHNEVSKEVPATCLSDGYTLSVCTRCGTTRQDAQRPALGHAYNVDLAESDSQTCTEAGRLVYVCLHCQDTYEESLPPFGHKCHEEFSAASCTENGYTRYTCGACGYTYCSDLQVATSHDWWETWNWDTTGEVPTVTVSFTCRRNREHEFVSAATVQILRVEAPTCQAPGTTVYIATVTDDFGTTYTDTNSVVTGEGALPHTVDETKWEKGDDGYHHGCCTVCGAIVLSQEHTWEDTVTTPATCTTPGEKHRVCTVCLQETDVPLTPTGHLYIDGACALCGQSDPGSLCEHVLWATYATLAEGATRCTDGVVVTYVCQLCHMQEQETLTIHEPVEKERIDLTLYGSVCGGYAVYLECACGAIGDIAWDTACEIEQKDSGFGTISASPPPEAEHVRVSDGCEVGFLHDVGMEHSARCTVTGPIPCTFYAEGRSYWEKDPDACVIWAVCTFTFGQGEHTRTLTYPVGDKTLGQGCMPGHTYDVNDQPTLSPEEEAVYDVVEGFIGTCPVCGSTRKSLLYWTYEGDVSKEVSLTEHKGDATYWETYTWVACDWLGSGMVYQSAYWVEEMEDDPLVQAFGISQNRPLYWEARIQTLTDGETWQAGETVTMTQRWTYEGCVMTDTRESSLCDAHHDHSYSREHYDESFIKSRIILEPAACTQTGIGEEYCQICQTTEEEIPLGHLGHTFVRVRADMFACMYCGLQSSTGGNDGVVLGDLTAEKGGYDQYAVGCGLMGVGSLDDYKPYIQLVLHTPTTTGETEILLPDITPVYNENRADNGWLLGTYYTFARAEVEAAAEALGYAPEMYDVRFCLAPLQEEDIAYYGITLNDPYIPADAPITGSGQFRIPTPYYYEEDHPTYQEVVLTVTPTVSGEWVFRSVLMEVPYSAWYVSIRWEDGSYHDSRQYAVDLQAGETYTLVLDFYCSDAVAMYQYLPDLFLYVEAPAA